MIVPFSHFYCNNQADKKCKIPFHTLTYFTLTCMTSHLQHTCRKKTLYKFTKWPTTLLVCPGHWTQIFPLFPPLKGSCDKNVKQPIRTGEHWNIYKAPLCLAGFVLPLPAMHDVCSHSCPWLHFWHSLFIQFAALKAPFPTRRKLSGWLVVTVYLCRSYTALSRWPFLKNNTHLSGVWRPWMHRVGFSVVPVVYALAQYLPNIFRVDSTDI